MADMAAQPMATQNLEVLKGVEALRTSCIQKMKRIDEAGLVLVVVVVREEH